MSRVLAGDVGGTKTLLAIVETAGGAIHVERQQRYDSKAYPGLVPIVREFLAAGPAGERIESACLAVAGPVKNGESITPNLPWVIRARELADAVGTARVTLINDFAAVGWGIPHLRPDDLRTLQPGAPEPGGAIAYLGAGTGCGQGFIVTVDGMPHVMPSEGGHGDFAATDATEFAVLEHLQRQYGHVSYERVLSGAGLANLYRGLVAAGRPESPAVIAELTRDGVDPAAVVSRHGLEKTDATCDEALDLFVKIYGAEAGNLALRVLATGGVYIAGGIAPRIIDRIAAGGMLRAFNDKGRLSAFAAQIPLHVIMNTQVGLVGAAACAARALTV
jgi:glucokinase